MLASLWLSEAPSNRAAERLIDGVVTGVHRAFLLDFSEAQALATVVDRVRASDADPEELERYVRSRLSFITLLTEATNFSLVPARALIPRAAALAVRHNLSLADGFAVTQAIISDSVLVIAAPHLALPFEIMQSRIPQFQFELLS